MPLTTEKNIAESIQHSENIASFSEHIKWAEECTNLVEQIARVSWVRSAPMSSETLS